MNRCRSYSSCARMLSREKQVRLSNPQIDIRPANIEELGEVAALDEQFFPPAEIVSVEVFISWWQKNKTIFTVARSNEGIAGYYATLPFSAKALNRLVLGRLIDREIKPKDILGERKARECEELYLFSIVMKRRHPKLTLLLLSHLMRYLKKLRDEGHLKKMYAVGATSDGESLLRKFNFHKVREGTESASGHPLYSKDVSQAK